VKLRDFTSKQLRSFDGVSEPSLYVAVDGQVYNVSSSSHFGASGQYHCCVGKAITIGNCPCMKEGERDVVTALAKEFEVVGKLSEPLQRGAMKRADLKIRRLNSKRSSRIHEEILVALHGKVYDVSYGGYYTYGPTGGYRAFAGKDITRALVKMSFAEEDVSNPSIVVEELSPSEKESLDKWVKMFSTKYPVVGTIIE
jgi:predicted heme/steroid binding protein